MPTRSFTLDFAGRAGDVVLGRVGAGGTVTFRATLKKGGVAWDLASGSAALTFEKPDRATRFTRAMTAEDAAAGVFAYTTAAGELDTAGYWTLGVQVTESGGGASITDRYAGEIAFEVAD